MHTQAKKKNDSEVITNYIKQRDTYLQNAENFYKRGKYRKSSEMLWGAITQNIKALAATADIEIKKHKEFFIFMETITEELNNEYYYAEFLKINNLHRNFYDEFIPPDAFDTVYREALKYLSKLDELLKSRIKQRIEKTNSSAEK